MTDETPNETIRLQKLLGAAGLASRRVIESMIIEGRISVNGEVAVLGTKASTTDAITLDGNPLTLNAETVTYLLHKPLGVISTASDEQGRQTVVDLIDSDERLFPIGRLDAQTSGLILISNDGDLTHKLTHPKFGVDKKYVARLEGHVNQNSVDELREGVELEDGMTAPAHVRVLARKSDQTLIEISIHEGRNRQIRRMAEVIGHPVISLQRIQIGPIHDEKLKSGQYRLLTVAEIQALYGAASSENVSRSAKRFD